MKENEIIKQNIASIYDTKGEEYFRNLASQVLKNFTKNKNTIIAYRGGIIQLEINRDILIKNITYIWLKADIAYCLNQIKGNNRLTFSQNLYKIKIRFINFLHIFYRNTRKINL
jgi:shikimate kinase